jgi:hypothetical protein
MFRFPLAACLAALLTAGPASAQAIGDASFVRKDVRGIMAGRVVPVSTGDTVYRDQIIRTAADSSTVLVFLDKSSMAIGPLSEVRLDEFVFKASAGPRTVDAVRGFFRFISGAGAKAHDYSVRTPHATIAVRGTTFDVRVTEAGTMVVLHDGAVDVCSAGECRSLSPGHAVETRNKGKGMGDVRPILPTDWTYGESAKEHRAALEASKAAMDRFAQANGVRTVASAKQAALAAGQVPAGQVPAAKTVDPALPATPHETSGRLDSPKPEQIIPAAAAPTPVAPQPAAPQPPVLPPLAAVPPAPQSAEMRPAMPVAAHATVPPARAVVAAPASDAKIEAAAPSPTVAADVRAVAPSPVATASLPDPRPSLAVASVTGSEASGGVPDRARDALAGTAGTEETAAPRVAVVLLPAPLVPPQPRHQAVVRAGEPAPAPRDPMPASPERINQAVIPNNKGEGGDSA